MHIAIVNHSDYFASPAKAAVLALIAEACTIQMRRHVAPTWGTDPWTAAYYDLEAKAPPGSVILGIFHNSDQAGALGYHDVTPAGLPYSKVFEGPIFANGGTETSGDNSVSCTASHECVEAQLDPDVNVWRQGGDGSLTVQEGCDAVEGDSYDVGTASGQKVSVSNFLTPNYFRLVPRAGEKFDYLDRLPGPYPAMTAGGYVSRMPAGRISQVFARSVSGDHLPALERVYGAAYPEWKKAGKDHPASRTARRLRDASAITFGGRP